DHRQVPAANFDTGHIDDARSRMRVQRRELIRRQNRYDFGDTRNRPQRFFADLVFVADNPDDGAIGAAAQVGTHPEFFNPSDHVFDLLLGYPGFQYQYHG